MPAEAAIGAVVTQAAAGVAEAVGSAAPAVASTAETVATAASTAAQAGAVGTTEAVGSAAPVAEAAAETAAQATTQGAEAVAKKATILQNVVRVTGTRGPDAGLRALGGQGNDTWGSPEAVSNNLSEGKPLSAQADGSETAVENPPVDSASAPEPNRVAEPPETDEDAPVGERLTTAKSRRTEAKMALREGRKNGLSQQELLKLQEEYEDAESLYRDTQAESDRSYADQRVASIQEKLDVALRSNATLEARLSQTEQRMAEAIEALTKLINAKTEEEKKSLLELLAQIVVYMTAGIVGDMVTDVKDAASEPPPQRR